MNKYECAHNIDNACPNDACHCKYIKQTNIPVVVVMIVIYADISLEGALSTSRYLEY